MKLYNLLKNVCLLQEEMYKQYSTHENQFYIMTESLWLKKESRNFDVTLGAYDGMKVYELIGIYMLYLIGRMYDSKNIGLYRDEGLPYSKMKVY